MRNPVNRVVSMLGLLMIGVVGYQLAMGSVGIEDAAIRAGITLGAAIVVRRMGATGMAMLADSMDREAERAASSAE
jgi:hypothetical protein